MYSVYLEIGNGTRLPQCRASGSGQVKESAVSHPDIVHTTDVAFEHDVLKSDKPVLVDFWAEWCGPCRAIGPLVDEIAQERRHSLRVVKVNVDDSPATARKFGIRGIPTLMLFRNGSIVAQQVGALRKPELADFLDSAV